MNTSTIRDITIRAQTQGVDQAAAALMERRLGGCLRARSDALWQQ